MAWIARGLIVPFAFASWHELSRVTTPGNRVGPVVEPVRIFWPFLLDQKPKVSPPLGDTQ